MPSLPRQRCRHCHVLSFRAVSAARHRFSPFAACHYFSCLFFRRRRPPSPAARHDARGAQALIAAARRRCSRRARCAFACCRLPRRWRFHAAASMRFTVRRSRRADRQRHFHASMPSRRYIFDDSSTPRAPPPSTPPPRRLPMPAAAVYQLPCAAAARLTPLMPPLHRCA